MDKREREKLFFEINRMFEENRTYSYLAQKVFRKCSKKFIIHILRKLIVSQEDPVIYTDFEFYDKEYLEYIYIQNSARLEKRGEHGIVKPEVIYEIKEFIRKFEEKEFLPVTKERAVTRKYFSGCSFEELSKAIQLKLDVSSFDIEKDEPNLFLPTPEFSKLDMDKNFKINPHLKFIFNSEIPLQNYDTNGIRIQTIILKVADKIGVRRQYPVYSRVLCSKCSRENIVSYVDYNNGRDRCTLVNEMSIVCNGKIFITEHSETYGKNLYLYHCQVLDGNFQLTDENSFVFASFVPLHCSLYEAQILQHSQESDLDGYILSVRKHASSYKHILAPIEEYAKAPAAETTPHDDLALMQIYNQLRSFFLEQMKFSLTNKGLLISLSIIAQCLTKKFERTNNVHILFVGDKSMGKTFLMNVLPNFFFNEISAIYPASTLRRPRYAGGCTHKNSLKVVPGLIASYDLVRVDEYASVFERTRSGWKGNEIHDINKETLLENEINIGKGEGGEFPRRAIVILASNFLPEYIEEYKKKLRETWDSIFDDSSSEISFPEEYPLYRNLDYYNFNPTLRKAHHIVRTEFEQSRLHYMIPIDLPSLDRFMFVYFIEDLSKEEKVFEEINEGSSTENLKNLIKYIVDTDLFARDLERNYPEITLAPDFFAQVNRFYNHKLRKLNPNLQFEERRHQEIFYAIAKTIARLERTSQFNEKVERTLTLLFQFVKTPISRRTLNTGIPDTGAL